MQYHIVSYPRSGNHAVRAILEYCFHRPTLGCHGVINDPPIYQRPPNRKAGVISISDKTPIAYKSHFITGTLLVDRAVGPINGLLLVIRDPVTAITSHIGRTLNVTHRFRKSEIRRRVGPQVDAYMALVHYFRSSEARRRIAVEYERLLDPAQRLGYVNGLLARLDCSDRLDDPTLDRVQAISKDSQVSMRRRSVPLAEEIRDHVAAYVTYEEVKELLALVPSES